jgi:hypothetical protein
MQLTPNRSPYCAVVEGLEELGVHDVFRLHVRRLDLRDFLLLALAVPVLVLVEQERRAGLVPVRIHVAADVRDGIVRVVQAEGHVVIAEGRRLRNQRRIDGDEVRQGEVLLALFERHDCARGRDFEALHRLDADVHERRAALVGAFVRVHRAHDGHVLALARADRQLIREHHLGAAGRRDGLEVSGILGAGLRIPRIDLRGAAAHPQHDDGLRRPTRGLLRLGRLREELVRQGRRNRAARTREAEPQETPAVEARCALVAIHHLIPLQLSI